MASSVTYGGQGNVISRTVTTRSGCGCTTFIAILLIVYGIIELPWLVVPTIAILGGMFYANWKQQGKR